jgi:probable F420-dependent oxidoreductase
MTEVAGEVCDGFICHGFTTERYLREVTLPALVRGRTKAGKTLDDFEIVGPSFVVTGADEAELAAATTGTRQQIAFYGSTPAYRPVLELHGWGGLQDTLNTLSKQGKWKEMGELIDDEVLNTFAVVAEPEQIAPELHRRYGDVIQRIIFYTPYSSNAERWQKVIDDVKAA